MKPGPRKKMYQINIEHAEYQIAEYETGGMPERAAALRDFFRANLDHNQIERFKADLDSNYQPQYEDATRTVVEYKTIWNTKRPTLKYRARYLTTYDANGKRIKSVRDKTTKPEKI